MSANQPPPATGQEPMLGGTRRRRIDRDLLRRLLNLEDHEARSAAIAKVADLGAGRFYGSAMIAVLSPGAGYYQIGRLWKTSYSYEQKLAAMDTLVKLGGDQALGGLIVALGNDDTTLQRAAIWLIGQLPGSQAEQVLITILDDDRPAIWHAALHALSHRWHEPEIARLSNPHGLVVAEAARWVGDYSQVRAMPVLALVLRYRRRGSEDYAVAQAALVQAVGMLANRFREAAGAEAVTTLRAVLDDRATLTSVYRSALDALQRVGTEEAQAALIVYQTSERARMLPSNLTL